MSSFCLFTLCTFFDSFLIFNIFALKLFKLIFLVIFIKIPEQIRSVYEGATSRSVPIKADEDARKIDKDCQKVNTSLEFLNNVN